MSQAMLTAAALVLFLCVGIVLGWTLRVRVSPAAPDAEQYLSGYRDGRASVLRCLHPLHHPCEISSWNELIAPSTFADTSEAA